MAKLIRIDKYTNDRKIPTIPKNATYRYIAIFEDNDDIIQLTQYSKYGFDIDTNKTTLIYYEGDTMPELELEEATEADFNEQDHPRDEDGKFADKGSGTKISEFKETIKKRIEPKKEVQTIQKDISDNTQNMVWKAIDNLGIRDKIQDVAMQGSFEKGTDLPSSGSDLDLFVVFKTDIPEEERNVLGLKIGNMVLNKENAIQNGWGNFKAEDITATGKYREAYFNHKGQQLEIQIVPTRHLTLDQIKSKEYNGQPIKIGMERTPHQTAFMKKALKGKEHEVRILKQFMKDTGLYDSSMKSQGFSGYSAEVLIHNKGSFEDTLNFFANMKKGDIVGGEKGHEGNVFSLIDPIDPNRDLISAFSPLKIGRTIKTAKYFMEHGEPPKRSEPVSMQSVGITFKPSDTNADTIAGQIRKTQKSLKTQLEMMGFEVPSKTEVIIQDPNPENRFIVDVDRINNTDQDRKTGEMTINLGITNMTINEDFPTVKDISKMPKNTVDSIIDGLKKGNRRFTISDDGTHITSWNKRKYTNAKDAVEYLVNNVGDIKKSNIALDMKDKSKINVGMSKFENLI